MRRWARRTQHDWQVFGLAGAHPIGAPNGRRFPVVKTSALTAVVPAYRCGTVPDSHRVPSHVTPVPACGVRCGDPEATTDQLHWSDYRAVISVRGSPVVDSPRLEHGRVLPPMATQP